VAGPKETFGAIAALPRLAGVVDGASLLIPAWVRAGQAAFSVSPGQIVAGLGAGAPPGSYLRSDGTWGVPETGLPSGGAPGQMLVRSVGGAVWQNPPTPGPLHHLSATAAPTVSDDAAALYSPGSIWVDTAAGAAWICVDATVGAAVWEPLSGGGGGGGPDVEDEGTLEVAGATTLNFVGAGVTVTDAGGGVAEVSIPGGSGGSAEGRAHVVPTLSDFTWVNQGSASATQRSYGFAISATGNSSAHNWRILARAAPSTPYAIIARLRRFSFNASWHWHALGFRDSATGRLVSHGVYSAGVTPVLRREYWTNPTTQTAASADVNWWPILEWMRIRDDGTNIYGDISVNGDDWIQMFSLGRTAHLANPDQVWVGWNMFAGTGSGQLQVLSWEAA
jgi:hypothetical protein